VHRNYAGANRSEEAPAPGHYLRERKQGRQYTGLPGEGSNGTLAVSPQASQTIS
jgi:hypothetical protein